MGSFSLGALVVTIGVTLRVGVLALVLVVLIIVILIIILRVVISLIRLNRACFGWLSYPLGFLRRVIIVAFIVISSKFVISIFIKEVAIRINKTSILINVKALFVILAFSV